MTHTIDDEDVVDSDNDYVNKSVINYDSDSSDCKDTIEDNWNKSINSAKGFSVPRRPASLESYGSVDSGVSHPPQKHARQKRKVFSMKFSEFLSSSNRELGRLKMPMRTPDLDPPIDSKCKGKKKTSFGNNTTTRTIDDEAAVDSDKVDSDDYVDESPIDDDDNSSDREDLIEGDCRQSSITDNGACVKPPKPISSNFYTLTSWGHDIQPIKPIVYVHMVYGHGEICQPFQGANKALLNLVA
ncbi:hypothetical protein BFJ68_g16489 [Fusarium oxysporum]|uniref:DUF3295 domain-containing protein n=1 Tax=Fusarium oxysporum TaxID=5507 RepID=A0A420PCT0_FUSOX|nr:hypothetical protein BFJ68_g16489 [Fusarium oxysporum]